MLEISAAELLRTGAVSIRVFHGLSAGNTRQPPTLGELPAAPPPPPPPPLGSGGTMHPVPRAQAARTEASTNPPVRIRIASASCRSGLEPVPVLGSQCATCVHPESEEWNRTHRAAAVARLWLHAGARGRGGRIRFGATVGGARR